MKNNQINQLLFMIFELKDVDNLLHNKNIYINRNSGYPKGYFN